MNNTMCIDKDKECPINLILLSNSSIPPSEYKYNFSHISFSDGSYLHFTNEAIAHYILHKFKISDKEVCLDPNEYNSPYQPYALDYYNHYGCLSSMNNISTNSNCKYLDSMSKY